MKKKLCMLMSFIMLMCIPVYADNSNIGIVIDGTEVAAPQPPVINNGRTLVPLRVIAENLNCFVEWNGDTKTVSVIKGNTTINFQIDNTVVSVINKSAITEMTIDTPASIINSTTMVPIRTVSEILEAKVEWDNVNKTVKIFTSNNAPATSVQTDITDIATAQKTEKSNFSQQAIREVTTKLDDNCDLNITLLPDEVNDYLKSSEKLNVYLYNRNGKLIFQELGENITITDNNDYIYYILDTDDVVRTTDKIDFTSYTKCTLKLEITVNDTVCSTYEGEIGPRFVYSSISFSDGTNINLDNTESNISSMNKMNIRFRFSGEIKNPDNKAYYLKCYDIRNNEVDRVPLGFIFSKGEFDFAQTYEIPLSAAYIRLES